MTSTTCGSRLKPRCPAHGKRSTLAGSTLSMTTDFGICPRMMRPPRPTPTSACNASSRLPSVADRPQTLRPGWNVRSRARASSVSTPRLEPSSSCHSSTTTQRSPAKRSRPSACVRKSDRLSGVVTSTVGSRFFCLARIAVVVSPVRVPTSQFSPSACSGASSDNAVSPDSARSGVIQSTRSGGGESAGGSSSASSTGPRKAA